MSGNFDELLSPRTVAGHIEEIVRLAERLAVDHKVGTPPQQMVTSVVGIRDFMFRLLGHFEEVMKSPCERRPGNPVGFQAPDRHGEEPE
jgi:hypothetical protein